MSMEAKVVLLNRLEGKLADTLPLNMMNDVMAKLTDELQGFSVELSDDTHSENDDCVMAFLDAKRVEGKSDKTLYQYNRTISAMMKSIGVQTREISIYHLRGYLRREKQRGLSDRTVENARQIISSYFNWLQRESLIAINPAANLGKIKYINVVRKPFTDVEFERMKMNCVELRDRAILMFLNSTGCRVGEVERLNKRDIDFRNLECKVLGKGNKERIVFIDDVAATILKDYLDSRNDDNEALFVSEDNPHKRLQQGGIRAMLKRIEKASGVGNVHPHKFRRTLATHLTSNGMPVQEVAAILGHEKIDTTMKYVCMNKDDIHYSYRRYK